MSTSEFDIKSFLTRAAVGLVFVMIVAAPVSILVLREDADPTWVQRVVIYVCLALAAGVIFSVAVVSKGEVGWKRLGVTLSGGAGIGVGVIIAVHQLLPPPPPVCLLTVSRTGVVSENPAARGTAIREVIKLDSQRFVVIRDAQENGEPTVQFRVISPTVDGPKTEDVTYRVSRTGRATRVVEQEGSE